MGKRNTASSPEQIALREARAVAYQRLMEADVRLSGVRERGGLGDKTLADWVDPDELEREHELYLATLARYVETLGGHLDVQAVFPSETVTVLTLPDPRP